jgi:hypothetical protein
VTRVSPSSPKPGGENSAGTLPKFRKQRLQKRVCCEDEEKKKEFQQKETANYLVRRWKFLLGGPFLF